MDRQVESLAERATSLPTLVQMVAGGLGITLLPEAAAAALVPPTLTHGLWLDESTHSGVAVQ